MMRKMIFAILMAGLMLVISFNIITVSAEENQAVFFGRVIDSKGRGISGASILASGENGDIKSCITGSDGSFNLIVNPESSGTDYTITASAEGYESETQGPFNQRPGMSKELIFSLESDDEDVVVTVNSVSSTSLLEEALLVLKSSIVLSR